MKASLPPTYVIFHHRRRHCQWWSPIAAYPILSLIISSNICVPPPVYLHFMPPYSLKTELDHPPPPPYASLENTKTAIWKDNRRKIRWNPIQSLILISILIRSPILILVTIQSHRLLPSPTPPPPLLSTNPVNGGCQHPQPGSSPRCHRRFSGIIITLIRPLHHLVGAFVFMSLSLTEMVDEDED